MKIVIISDVHGKYRNLVIPECDVLISCGDYSFKGEPHEVKDFHAWLDKQDAKYMISVQGNHELGVERNFQLSKEIAEKACPGVYFIDEGPIEIEGVKFWCSAITPFFFSWAWNRYRGAEIKKHWDLIPDDTDILVTHGPVYGILDHVLNSHHPQGEHVGCADLLDRVKKLKKLKLHCCGHIHCGNGTVQIDGVTFINASICDEQYKPSNKPYIFNI